MLLADGASADSADPNGETALILAARTGCLQISGVRLWVQNIRIIKTVYLFSSLSFTARYYLETFLTKSAILLLCFKVLLANGASVDAADNDSCTALMGASITGNLKIAEVREVVGAIL